MVDARAQECLLYTRDDVQERLKVSASTVTRLIAAGDLETVTIGRSRRIPSTSLAAYVARLRGGAA